MKQEMWQCSLPPGILSWAYALRGFLMPCMQHNIQEYTSCLRQATMLPRLAELDKLL